MDMITKRRPIRKNRYGLKRTISFRNKIISKNKIMKTVMYNLKYLIPKDFLIFVPFHNKSKITRLIRTPIIIRIIVLKS